MDDLKAKAVRGGFAKLCGQAANFALRIASVAILARLLDPRILGWLRWRPSLQACMACSVLQAFRRLLSNKQR